MKGWTGAGFPLALILGLAALTAWLQHAIMLPDEANDGKKRHDPDYLIGGGRVVRLDGNGQLQHVTHVASLTHYPDDDSTDVVSPKVIFLRKNQPPVTLSSQVGHVSADGEVVTLKQDVRIERVATADKEAMLARMETLVVFPDDERATSNDPVLITQGNSWLKGVGLDVDNDKQIYVLRSQAIGQFERKRK
jgi:lipopolysaccharide export system protein LptC